MCFSTHDEKNTTCLFENKTIKFYNNMLWVVNNCTRVELIVVNNACLGEKIIFILDFTGTFATKRI